jgi:hypothetical protein
LRALKFLHTDLFYISLKQNWAIFGGAAFAEIDWCDWHGIPSSDNVSNVFLSTVYHHTLPIRSA